MSFMNDTASTLGSINTSTAEKKRYARMSREFNLKDPIFCSVFEELAATLRQEIAEEKRIQAITGNSVNDTENEEQPS